MKERDLWIDFNDVGNDSRARSLMRYATRGAAITIGGRIIVGDDEGNRCEAVVLGIEGGMVDLAVDGNTFQHPDHADQPSLIDV